MRPQPVSLQDIRRLLYEPIQRISLRDWVCTLKSLSARKKQRVMNPQQQQQHYEPQYERPEWIAEILYQTSAHYFPLPPYQPRFTFTTEENTETSSSKQNHSTEAEQFLSTY